MADQQAEVIRAQMAETRASMTEKIEALEKQVSSTVQETTENVAETVEAARDTVHETVSAVSRTVEAVKTTFDIPEHFRRHPWMAMGGSLAFGFALGLLLTPARQRRAAEPRPAPAPVPEPVPAPAPVATEVPQPAEEKRTNLHDVLTGIKGMAIGTAVGLLGNVLLASAPQDLKAGLSKLVNEISEALGGKPIMTPGSEHR
jgi:ElaB/YqjD/DUF883 family membrane-anchored ribosome-binding protein